MRDHPSQKHADLILDNELAAQNFVVTAAVDRSDRSRDRSIESIDSIDSIIFRSFEIFSNCSWRRCDSNGPKIIKIRAILAKKFGRINSDEKNGGQGTGAKARPLRRQGTGN